MKNAPHCDISFENEKFLICNYTSSQEVITITKVLFLVNFVPLIECFKECKSILRFNSEKMFVHTFIIWYTNSFLRFRHQRDTSGPEIYEVSLLV